MHKWLAFFWMLAIPGGMWLVLSGTLPAKGAPFVIAGVLLYIFFFITLASSASYRHDAEVIKSVFFSLPMDEKMRIIRAFLEQRATALKRAYDDNVALQSGRLGLFIDEEDEDEVKRARQYALARREAERRYKACIRDTRRAFWDACDLFVRRRYIPDPTSYTDYLPTSKASSKPEVAADSAAAQKTCSNSDGLGGHGVDIFAR